MYPVIDSSHSALKKFKKGKTEKNFVVGETKRGGKDFQKKGGTQLFELNSGIEKDTNEG